MEKGVDASRHSLLLKANVDLERKAATSAGKAAPPVVEKQQSSLTEPY
ncbi:MAG: hypothetical protein ACE3JP_16965 [Ectobacillus sp.]